MRKEIEKIYYNLHELVDDYNDLQETEDSRDRLWDYMREHDIFADRHMELDIDTLLAEYGTRNERQGFIYGFEYAVRLFTCQGGGLQCQ